MIKINGIKVGHITNHQQKTGLTVFLCERPSPCGRWLCGGAPATRDVDLLAPDALVDRIDALLFTGGSAFGLDAAGGVMRWLREQNRGWPTYHGPIPIVPTVAIYDRHAENAEPPTPLDAYQACLNSDVFINASGEVGAGTGAQVGKLLPNTKPMPGGFGYANLKTADNLEVAACVVVNSVGDIIGNNNTIIAGACMPDGSFANTQAQLLSGKIAQSHIHPPSHTNTTLVAIFTNALFNKAALTRISRMASAGIAKCISPAFSMVDGDMVFSVSLSDHRAEEIMVGTLAAEATRQAIIQAVTQN